MNGYKTLYATPGAPAQAIAAAEDTARRLYRIVGSRPERAFGRVHEDLWGFVRGFAFGTDHAGRARTCVHTIFVTGEDLAKIPWFNPFTFPDDLFLPADLDDLQYLRFNLKQAWSVPAASFDPAAHWAQYGPSVPEPILRMLVPSMIERDRPAIVLNRRDNSFDLARILAYALPPSARRRLTYLDRAMLNPTPYKLNFFANNPDPSVLAGDEILLDLNRYESHNDPLRNAYADFAIDSLAPGGDPAPLWRLVSALERFDPAFAFANPLQCKNVISAFKAHASLFRADGSPAVSDAPGDANEAVAVFVAVGLRGLAYAMLREVGAIVEQRFPDKAPKVRRRVDAVCLSLNQTGDPVADVKKLIAEFRPAFGAARAVPTSDDDTFISPPTIFPGGAIEKSLGFED